MAGRSMELSHVASGICRQKRYAGGYCYYYYYYYSFSGMPVVRHGFSHQLRTSLDKESCQKAPADWTSFINLGLTSLGIDRAPQFSADQLRGVATALNCYGDLAAERTILELICDNGKLTYNELQMEGGIIGERVMIAAIWFLRILPWFSFNAMHHVAPIAPLNNWELSSWQVEVASNSDNLSMAVVDFEVQGLTWATIGMVHRVPSS